MSLQERRNNSKFNTNYSREEENVFQSDLTSLIHLTYQKKDRKVI